MGICEAPDASMCCRGVFRFFIFVQNVTFVFEKSNLVNELDLWKDIQRGDKKAFKKLHELHFYPMCLFAYKSVNDRQIVESVVSDCFVRLWEHRREIQIRSSLKSYLYRMLKNQLIDHFRKNQEFTERVVEVADIADEVEFDAQQKYAKLYRALTKLPQQRRKILELAVFDALTYQEIADRLHISKNTVKTQISRAYRFLKDTLDPRDFYYFCWLQKKQK